MDKVHKPSDSEISESFTLSAVDSLGLQLTSDNNKDTSHEDQYVFLLAAGA
jgi:hypothetical protein